MLATLVFDMGPDIEVMRGETFFIEVRVQDQRPGGGAPTPGVISLPIDISWDHQDSSERVVSFSGTSPDADPDPSPGSFAVPLGNPLVTDDFPLQRRLTDYIESDAGGEFVELRGASLPAANEEPDPPFEFGRAIGTDDPEVFSRLEFTAEEVGETIFRVTLAGSMSFADAAVLDNDPVDELVVRVVPPQQGSLSGLVYADADNDGRQKADQNGAPEELGLPNVVVSLFRRDASAEEDGYLLVTRVTTGPDGWYHFEDLAPGIYRIEETQPECFIDGKDTPGRILNDGEDVTPTTIEVADDQFSEIPLSPGDRGIDFNFGEAGLKAVCITKRSFFASSLQASAFASRLDVEYLVVRGTANSDEIIVEKQDDAVRVTVNGHSQDFPVSDTQPTIVKIDAGGDHDQDTVVLNGSDANETARVLPSVGAVRDEFIRTHPDLGAVLGFSYAVEVVRAEDVTVDLGEGDDLSVIRDSPGDDQFSAAGAAAEIAAPLPLNKAGIEFLARVVALDASDQLRAVSATSEEDEDVANVEDVDFVLELLGDWQSP